MSRVFADVCNDNRYWNATLVCQYMTLSSQFASISRIWTNHVPPKGAFTDTLSSDCHVHLIPLRSSYISNSLTHNFWNTSDTIHCWNRLPDVEPEPYSFSNIFHRHPVLKTYRIPSRTLLNGTTGRPIVLFDFSGGSISLISSHKSSGILLMVWRCFFYTSHV